MTWGPHAHHLYRNFLGDRDGHSLGEPRDRHFSPWPHWALSGMIIKPQTWFYHSWKELVTAVCTTHPIFLTVWLQKPWRGEGMSEPLLRPCRDISSLSAALWTAPKSGREQSRWAISWSEYLKAQPQLWWYKCWAHVHSCVMFTAKILIPWACTHRPSSALHSCTSALRLKQGGLCLIPGDFESCWCLCFGCHLFQWGALRGYVCSRAGTTELWAFGASVYHGDLGKTAAWIFL